MTVNVENIDSLSTLVHIYTDVSKVKQVFPTTWVKHAREENVKQMQTTKQQPISL